MKPYSYLPILLLSSFVVLTNSCTKDNISHNEQTSISGIYVKDGMLVFKDVNILQETLQKVSGFSSDDYQAWIKNYPGFDSYKLKFNNALDAFDLVDSEEKFTTFLKNHKSVLKISQDTSLTELFASPVVSNVVDSKGRFMVGESLNILTDNEWIAINNPNGAKIRESLNKRVTDTLKGIFVSNYRENNRRILADAKNQLKKEDLLAFSLGEAGSPPATLPLFYNRTKTVGKRRLTVQFIADHNPADVDPTDTDFTTYPRRTRYTITLMVNAEYKNLFGWHRHTTGHRVSIPTYSVGFWPGVPYPYPIYFNSSLIWETNAKGPFYLQLHSVYSRDQISLITHDDSKIWTDWVTIAKFPWNE